MTPSENSRIIFQPNPETVGLPLLIEHPELYPEGPVDGAGGRALGDENVDAPTASNQDSQEVLSPGSTSDSF